MNVPEPSPSAQFSALLSRFSPESIALAKRCMPKLRRAIPGAFEIVYEYNHSVVVSFSLSERGYEGLVTLAIYPDWVRLYFLGGKFLPDPKGLLQGSAGVRYVTLESASDLDKPDIRALFKAAIKHAGVTLPRTGTSRMVFKSASKKSKPKAKAKRKKAKA